jgi:hypothetical protein
VEFRIDVDVNGFILCVLDGDLNLGIARQALLRARVLALEHGYGVVYDVRRVSAGGVPGELYELGLHLEESHAGGASAPIRAAIVCHESKDKALWQFVVLVAQNAGVEAQLFDSGPPASNWVTEGKDPPRAPGS